MHVGAETWNSSHFGAEGLSERPVRNKAEIKRRFLSVESAELCS